MTLAAIIAAIFKFWPEVYWLIEKLEGTPAEKQQDLMAKLRVEAKSFEGTDRPKWD